jgi:hypothetical protein
VHLHLIPVKEWFDQMESAGDLINQQLAATAEELFDLRMLMH